MLNNFALWFIIQFSVDVAMGSASRRRRIQLSGKNEGINPVFHHHGCFANLFSFRHSLPEITYTKDHMLAIIGGSSLTKLPELSITDRKIVRTPYGLTSSPVLSGKTGQSGHFLPRAARLRPYRRAT